MEQSQIATNTKYHAYIHQWFIGIGIVMVDHSKSIEHYSAFTNGELVTFSQKLADAVL